MEIKAPAKINLYFQIKGKRDDGYHEIYSVVQTIDIFDHLVVEKADEFTHYQSTCIWIR